MPILELIEDNDVNNPFLVDSKTKTPDFEQLTEEEQNALLDHIASQVANDPKAFERLASTFLGQVKKQDFNTVNIQPQPGFVCKTHVVSSSNKKYKVGTVVYINICYASAIPAPPIASEAEIQKALNAEENAYYKVPLSMGQERQDDRGSLVMDACINTQPYLRSEKDLDFRLYILELSMEYVEEIVHVTLSREFTMPNTPSVGQIPSRVLRLPKPSLMTAIRTELNPKVEWELKPQFSVIKDMLTVVIPMPDNNSTSWTLDITSNQLLLTLQKELHKIPLKGHTIDVDASQNKVDFYSKSRELVIQLKLVSKTQYL